LVKSLSKRNCSFIFFQLLFFICLVFSKNFSITSTKQKLTPSIWWWITSPLSSPILSCTQNPLYFIQPNNNSYARKVLVNSWSFIWKSKSLWCIPIKRPSLLFSLLKQVFRVNHMNPWSLFLRVLIYTIWQVNFAIYLYISITITSSWSLFLRVLIYTIWQANFAIYLYISITITSSWTSLSQREPLYPSLHDHILLYDLFQP
jgi:hypothetical protein